ncbi:PIR Superfamily Protein [Plasmodium ovale wallikeri]|uniref:PIR Superfamily Protein n=1 Tax=Plasmodium ovale wallikeri TaxID=864142 RepID=A0A1A9AI31_PLAOA|nr:PIR Superfamily Protein [Plasmodium ovale wallikeri]SBT55816.1 PIR Superfamily Protein [Plasmodium ovale wallikeri]
MSSAYSFFENFKTYKLYEREMEQKFLGGKHGTQCDSFSSSDRYIGTESANNICIKFKILYDIIKSKKKPPNPISLDDNDFAYLNYWLNSISRNTTVSNKLTIKEFQTQISNVELEFVLDYFDQKLYDFVDNDYNNMILLNDLHEKHGQIFQSTISIEENTQCVEYFQKYINTYKKGIIMCPQDDTSFCKALKHFKKLYEKTFLGEHGMTENCIDRERLQLPTYNDVLLERKNNTIAGTILGSSFGTLFTMVFMYKFTPLGRWIHAKVVTNKEVYSNIYEESEESLLSTSDNDYINSDFNEYHISYNSVTNS